MFCMHHLASCSVRTGSAVRGVGSPMAVGAASVCVRIRCGWRRRPRRGFPVSRATAWCVRPGWAAVYRCSRLGWVSSLQVGRVRCLFRGLTWLQTSASMILRWGLASCGSCPRLIVLAARPACFGRATTLRLWSFGPVGGRCSACTTKGSSRDGSSVGGYFGSSGEAGEAATGGRRLSRETARTGLVG